MISLAQRKAGVPFIALMAAVLLVLTGCSGSSGGSEKTETIFEQSLNGVSLTITFVAEGDRILEETTVSEFDYEPNGFADKEAAKTALDDLMADFKIIDGMTHSIKYGDTSATERLVIDYTVVDPEELAEITGTPVDEAAMKEAVSLKIRSEQLEASGFIKAE